MYKAKEPHENKISALQPHSQSLTIPNSPDQHSRLSATRAGRAYICGAIGHDVRLQPCALGSSYPAQHPGAERVSVGA